MDKNPPANAGHTGLIPGLGRFHVLALPPLLSLSGTTTETVGLEPVLQSREALQ